jgi:hypothetical protein
MSSIRKAHSVEIIDRRLRNCETGECEVMELVGLHDELARVERKWLEKAVEMKRGRPSTRPLANAEQMNGRFDRLTLLVDAALRKSSGNGAERQFLQHVADALHARKPLSA